jgi:arginyl-tRNA synthetase
MVDIFGSDHLDTSRDVVILLQALLGEKPVSDRLRVILHQFVTLVRDGRKVKMSTRAANFVTLRDLVEEAGSPDVTRYLFLTRKAEAHMEFDLELARRQSDDNPVFYVQYACARISGILRNALAEGLEPEVEETAAASLLTGTDERRLMRLLEAVPVRTSAAAASLEPHRLTEILHELATSFHGFYQRVHVVDPGDPALSRARLMLCSACRNTMRDLLGILGVGAPERM